MKPNMYFCLDREGHYTVRLEVTTDNYEQALRISTRFIEILVEEKAQESADAPR